MTNAEDLVQVPGTPWIVASGLAEGEHAEGHIYLVNAHDRTVQVVLPGHVVDQQDTETFGACPGAPDETKFSAHGLSLRVGSAEQLTVLFAKRRAYAQMTGMRPQKLHILDDLPVCLAAWMFDHG